MSSSESGAWQRAEVAVRSGFTPPEKRRFRTMANIWIASATCRLCSWTLSG